MQTPVSVWQIEECPKQLQGLQRPRYRPSDERVYPVAQSSQDWPLYPEGHEHCSTDPAFPRPPSRLLIVDNETDEILKKPNA